VAPGLGLNGAENLIWPPQLKDTHRTNANLQQVVHSRPCISEPLNAWPVVLLSPNILNQKKLNMEKAIVLTSYI
jgi:hypothetical protein